MKGLFLAFGLIAALFVSNVQASIYDYVSYITPDQQSMTEYKCHNSNYTSDSLFASGNYPSTTESKHVLVPNCDDVMEPKAKAYFDSFTTLYKLPPTVDWYGNASTSPSRQWKSTAYNSYPNNPFGVLTYDFTVSIIGPSTSTQCEDPVYYYPYDLGSDGTPDRCYNPIELDNASKCADLFNSGSILTAGSNTAPLVCKTFEDGSRCAFSLVSQGSTPYYQPNLEVGCFGDGQEIPDYDNNSNDPQPQPEQCVPYAGGYACAADPNQYCSADHRCIEGCGYVNDQFICFRDEQCTGASCEPAPVNCENSPDAPVCKDKQTTPEPTFCEKNPSVASCQGDSEFCKKYPTAPSCQVTGGGGSGSEFSLDYDKLINGMKDAVKLLIDSAETPDFDSFQSDIDDKTSQLDSDIDAFMNGAHFDGINQQISTNPFAGQFQLPSGGSCSPFDLGGHSVDLCGAAQKISSILYFVFGFLTLLYLKNLFFSTVTPRKE